VAVIFVSASKAITQSKDLIAALMSRPSHARVHNAAKQKVNASAGGR
jgi:hypothetical protein